MALQPQDRVVVFERSRHINEPGAESVYWFQKYEPSQQLVHALTGTCDRRTLKIDDILDVQVEHDPVVFRPRDEFLIARGMPLAAVRPIGAEFSRHGAFRGFLIQTDPEKATWSFYECSLSCHGLSEADVLRCLPVFGRTSRGHGASVSRDQLNRVAERRIRKFLSSEATDIPIDPSLRKQGGLYLPKI